MINVVEFYNKLNDQERKIFYVAIAALVLAFFDVLFLRPVLSRMEELEEQIRSTTLAVKRDIRFISYHDKIMAEDKGYSKYETDESKAGEEIIAGFLKTIEVIASETKVNLSKVTPSDVSQKKGFVQYFANVECSGNLKDMVTFMHRIDSTDNLLKIVRFNMTGNKASKDQVKVEMKVVKLVIDPATIGNYEFDAKGINMPQKLLDDAAEKIGLMPSGQGRTGGAPSSDAQTVRRGRRSESGQGLNNGAGETGAETGGVGGRAGSGAGKAGTGAGGTGAGGTGGAGAGAGGTGAGGTGGAGAGAGGTGAGGTGAGAGGTGAGAGGTGAKNIDRRGFSSSGQGGVPAEQTAQDLYLGKNSSSRRRQQDVPQDETTGSQQATKQPKKEETKLQKSFQDIHKGGRVRVDSLDTLWEKFMAKIFGKQEELQPADQGSYDDQADQPTDERNLWERKIR